MVLYWTFIPGYYREVLVLLKYAWVESTKGMPGLSSPISLLDAPRVLRFLAAIWRLLVGRHYVPGRTFRYLDRLVTLSLPLEVGALGSAVLFVAVRMWFRGWAGGREEGRRWSVFTLVRPWTAWAVCRVARAVLLPAEELEHGRAAALVA
jgi:hypothetical protein